MKLSKDRTGDRKLPEKSHLCNISSEENRRFLPESATIGFQKLIGINGPKTMINNKHIDKMHGTRPIAKFRTAI